MFNKFSVDGIEGVHCAGKLIELIKSLVGVIAIDVNLSSEYVVVYGDDYLVEDVINVLGHGGYRVIDVEQLSLEMIRHCA